MLKSFIKIFASTPNCPHCNSSNTEEVITIFGKTKYKCIDCTHSWWE